MSDADTKKTLDDTSKVTGAITNPLSLITFKDVFNAFDMSDKSPEVNGASGHMAVPAGYTEQSPVINPKTGNPYLAAEDGHVVTYEDIDFYLKDGVPNAVYNKSSDQWEGWFQLFVGGKVINANAGKQDGDLAWGNFRIGPESIDVLQNPAYTYSGTEAVRNFGESIWNFATGGDLISGIVSGVLGAVNGQVSGTMDLALRAKAAHDHWLSKRRAAMALIRDRADVAYSLVMAERARASSDIRTAVKTQVDTTGLDAFVAQQIAAESSALKQKRVAVAVALPAAAVVLLALLG